LQTRTQTIYLRKHTHSRSLPQIRRRHNTHYADIRIMPTMVVKPLVVGVDEREKSA